VEEASDFDRARHFAEQALAAMIGRKIAPTPHNFSVWYAHTSGAQPELSRTIEILDSNRVEFTPERNLDLYEQLLGASKEAEQIREAGERISAAAGVVLTLLQKAGAGTEKYGAALGQVSDKIDAEKLDADRLQVIVEAILDETKRMVVQNEEIVGKLAQSSQEIEGLRKQIESARRETLIDALTGVGNRRMFDMRLRESLKQALEEGGDLCLLMADIDHFKRFNDTFGHQLGDLVLRLVAKALTDGIKGRDVACRYGGEEFGILLPKTRIEDALKLADGLRTSIGSRRIIKRGESRDLGHVTLSMGVSRYRPGEPAAQFVQRADAALYSAKRRGRNRVVSESDVEAGELMPADRAKG
jgi:diguanylate cyclase